MTLKILVEISDAGAAAIAAERLARNAEMPPRVLDGDSEIPNPALFATDTEYFLLRVQAMVALLVEKHNPPAPAPPPQPPITVTGVPQAVDMVKAEVYFIRIGVAGQIKAAISAAGAEAQAIWARSRTIQRHNPLMIQIATLVLGWSDAEIDQHFIEADKVVV